jgi:alkanesulfonate monooxygenase SsuD/methylene tetrahydromethanopterin reductase-like flavin-dependent oxidoreductase (luciferase family)
MDAIAHYRTNFQPSATLKQPYVIVGANVFAAATRGEAEYLASSHRQWVSRLYAGKPGPLPKPVDGYMEALSHVERHNLAQAMACTAVGDKEDVGSWLRQFIATTQADEIIIDARIYDPEARCQSYQIAAESIEDMLG